MLHRWCGASCPVRYCFGFDFSYDDHYSSKKSEIPGYIELLSYSRISSNLVPKSKLLLRVDVQCT